MVMGTRESHFFIYYKRLGVFAKLATTWMIVEEGDERLTAAELFYCLAA
jgi:hypothetical protein